MPLEQGLNGLQGLDDMRSKSVPQLSSIELLFSPDTDLLRARQLVQERLAIVSPTLPTWAAPPVMLAAGVGHRPRHADRHDLEEELTHRDVTDGVLEHPDPPAPGAGRRQRRDLERAPPADERAGRAGPDGRQGGHPRPGHGDHRGRRRLGTAEVLRPAASSEPAGIDRDGEPALVRAERPAHRHAGRPRQGAGQGSRQAHRWRSSAHAGRRGGRRADPPAAHRRRGHQLGAGDPPRRREAAVGNTLERDLRASRRPSTSCSPACPTSRSTPTSSGRPTSSSSHLEPLPGAAPRLPARGRHPRAVPLRLAGGADQPAHHPAVAGGHAAGAPPGGRDDQHDGPGRPRDRAGRGGRRRDHRRREHRPPAARTPRVGQLRVDGRR